MAADPYGRKQDNDTALGTLSRGKAEVMLALLLASIPDDWLED